MKAIFRCDATTDIGFGHLSRCLALAEALRISGIPTIFAGLFDPVAKDQIAALGPYCAGFAGAVNTTAGDEPFVELMAQEPESFIIVDSYRADEAYLSSLRGLGKPTVVLDDFGGLESYPCDAVLNFTWEAKSLAYPANPVLLLGPSYFPARRQLVKRRPKSMTRHRRGPVRNLLIVIGGSDPKRIGARLIRILRENHAEICLRVIAVDEADFDESLAGFTPGSLVLPRQPDLSGPLLWADACITGGGLIKYECAFMGVPAAAISQNAGQVGESRSLSRAGLVFDLGFADVLGDRELVDALDRFLADEDLRNGLTGHARDAFPSDPAAHAALSILQAVGS